MATTGRQIGAVEKKTPREAQDLLGQSHLSPSDAALAFHEFEFALHHISEAFARWSSAVHEMASGEVLPQADVSVLQLIRMNERPKSGAEIGRFLNRDDSSNILYALRKLEKAQLIEKSRGPLRQTTYQVTARGREVTDRYAELRRQVLLESVDKLAGSDAELGPVTQMMWRISGLYEQAARTMSVMRVLQGDTVTEAAAEAPKRKPRAKKAA
jgi:predicted MarR family transcription regulator